MAIADALPSGFKKLDHKYHVPRLGIMFMMILAVIAPFFGRQVLSWLVDMTAIGADLAFLYATAAALVTAWREGNKKQIVISGAGTIFSVAFILLLLIPGSPGFLSPQAWAFLVLWVVIGGVFFAVKRKDYYASTALEEKVATIAQEVENGASQGCVTKNASTNSSKAISTAVPPHSNTQASLHAQRGFFCFSIRKNDHFIKKRVDCCNKNL